MTTSTIDLLDLDRFQRLEHHEMFKRLRAENPVSWHEYPGGTGFWNVVQHEDVLTVSRDSELYSSEIGGVMIMDPEAQGGFDTRGLMMLYTDPPKHTRYRRLVSKGFTPRMIGLLEQYLRNRSKLIVDNVIERGSCDFVVDLASELPLQAIAEIMGVPQEDRRLIFEWSNAMIGADDPEFEGGPEGAGLASASLYAYVNDLAKQRHSDPQDDIVTKLINAEVEGEKLSELEFDMFMLLLSVAGNETTRNTTAWGMWALMQNPEQYASLRENLDTQLDPAIEEILRWASPVYHFRRTATAPAEIHGQEIAAGDRVVMWYISANRDEAVFDDPFRFDITRQPAEQVAFGGGGHHFCLGANLARMELKLIFQEVLERIPDMHLVAEPDVLRSNFIGGVKHMAVEFEPGARREAIGS
jgi:cholest-4-en-3-one 26-monooxygenase